jgi:signal peptidase
MALFFLYEVYNLIKIIMAYKVNKAKQEALSSEQEEEIKRKAVEEYLKSQQLKEENTNTAEDKE